MPGVEHRDRLETSLGDPDVAGGQQRIEIHLMFGDTQGHSGLHVYRVVADTHPVAAFDAAPSGIFGVHEQDLRQAARRGVGFAQVVETALPDFVDAAVGNP
jgi:hypothetical protein